MMEKIFDMRKDFNEMNEDERELFINELNNNRKFAMDFIILSQLEDFNFADLNSTLNLNKITTEDSNKI
jgi:hypothetical protein